MRLNQLVQFRNASIAKATLREFKRINNSNIELLTAVHVYQSLMTKKFSFICMEQVMNSPNNTLPAIEPCNHIPQLLSIKDVGNCTGLSRSTIYEITNEKSFRYDPTFPKKVQLTQIRVAWVASEIAEWINTKISER